MSPRYLVTGGAGFLGINLCRHLLAYGYKVRSIDIAPFAYPERSQVEVITGDIRHPQAVERAMESVDIDEPSAQIIADVLKSQFTRVPMWRENTENIVGILNIKDLLAALAAHNFDPAQVKLADLVQPAWFVLCRE